MLKAIISACRVQNCTILIKYWIHKSKYVRIRTSSAHKPDVDINLLGLDIFLYLLLKIVLKASLPEGENNPRGKCHGNYCSRGSMYGWRITEHKQFFR